MASAVANYCRDLEVPPLIIGLVVAGLVFIWQFLLPSKLDPREPPEVHATVPFVGHLFGMLWYRAEYITILRQVWTIFSFEPYFCNALSRPFSIYVHSSCLLNQVK